MKILFDGRVFSHIHYTGVENYAQSLYQKFSISNNITLLKPKSKNKILQHLWEHIFLPWKARRYDLLFSPANIAPIWKPKNTKLVMTLHDTAFLTHQDSISKLFYLYYKYAIPQALKISDRVITISEFSKREIIKNYPFVKDKIDVIYNGIDAKEFSPINHDDKERYILFVGSLNPRKNFIRLIKAFQIMSFEHDIELKIVGNFSDIFMLSDDEKALICEAKKSSKITFLEDIDNKKLVKLYQKAIIFVFPSIYEGFGLPPLEAMSCGTPVIVSNIASLPEACGDAALYVDPYNIDDISDKMKLLLEDEKLQTNLISKGLEQVGKFTCEMSAAKHIDVFKEVLKN